MTYIRDDVREEILARYVLKNNKYYSLRNLSFFDEMMSVGVRFGLRQRRSSMPYEVILVSTTMQLMCRNNHYGLHIITTEEMESVICGFRRRLGRPATPAI